MSENKVKIVSYWNKPGTRWVKNEKGGTREKTGLKMAMAIVEIEGKKVTRHIVV